MDTSRTQELTRDHFDVCITGGGISGAWLALHCAKSGLKTILLEQGDYASQTSSRSSKLLHGGIRYLQQLHFYKVRESALERAHYIHCAPHLSHTIPFLVPTYKDFLRSKFLLNCAMRVYQLLCIGERNIVKNAKSDIPGFHSIDADKLRSIIPLDDARQTGAVVFYEQHMVNSERMVLSIIQTAQDYGAKCLNYVAAESYQINDAKVTGVNIVDKRNGTRATVHARLTINATGSWIDELNSRLGSNSNLIKGYAIGAHIITRKISDHAIAISTKHASGAPIDRGGRHVFIIPWRNHSLIGTSYHESPHAALDIKIDSQQIRQLLDAVNDSLPKARLHQKDIVFGFSGLYPLTTRDITSDVYQGSGEYKIIDHARQNGVDGLITALGAKFTTARKLSVLCGKLISSKLNVTLDTSGVKLHASQYQDLAGFRESLVTRFASILEVSTIDLILNHFGSNSLDVLALAENDSKLAKPITSKAADIYAQLFWSASHEQVWTLEDLLFRRSSVGLLGISQEEIVAAAEFVKPILGWNDATLNSNIESVNAILAETRSAAM